MIIPSLPLTNSWRARCGGPQNHGSAFLRSSAHASEFCYTRSSICNSSLSLSLALLPRLPILSGEGLAPPACLILLPRLARRQSSYGRPRERALSANSSLMPRLNAPRSVAFVTERMLCRCACSSARSVAVALCWLPTLPSLAV